MHPFLNVKAMSDDEITKQIGKYQRYLNEQTQYGRNDVIQSIEGILDALSFERLERTRAAQIKQDIGVENEGLKSINLGKIEGEVDEPVTPRKTKGKSHGLLLKRPADEDG